MSKEVHSEGGSCCRVRVGWYVLDTVVSGGQFLKCRTLVADALWKDAQQRGAEPGSSQRARPARLGS